MTTEESMFIARNIVNQLADMWQVSVPVRQATNDKADKFVERLVLKYAAGVAWTPVGRGVWGMPDCCDFAPPNHTHCGPPVAKQGEKVICAYHWYCLSAIEGEEPDTDGRH